METYSVNYKLQNVKSVQSRDCNKSGQSPIPSMRALCDAVATDLGQLYHF